MGGINMIDGITIKTSINNLDEWLVSTNVKAWTSTDNTTGEIRSRKRESKIVIKRRGKWENYNIEIIEVRELKNDLTKYYLNIRGSLHKNNFDGANWQEFNWNALQNQVWHLCKSLFIEPQNARISRIEFGVNIETPFSVSQFLNTNVIDIKGRGFNYYRRDANGLELGLFCEFKQYSIKLYDKGKQYDLSYNLMRFEKKCIKMQVIKKSGIVLLSDLLDKQKLCRLKPMLLKAWDDILISDIENEDNLSPKITAKEYNLFLNGKSSNYWQKMKQTDVGQYNYNRSKFKKIVKRFGLNYHSLIRAQIEETWDYLFQNSTNLPLGIDKVFNEFTIKIKGNNKEYFSKYCNPCIWDSSSIVNYNKIQSYAI
jgi:hypothetical protein